MKVLNRVILLGGLLPAALAQSVDHSRTVLCITDKPVDSVLSYYVSSGEHPFCMNGGTCKPNFDDSPEFPCECPQGLTGPHCEFEEGVVPECELQCFNGGRCQAGIKYPSETVFKSNEDLQYCVCPEGYYGKRCEVEGQRCGEAHCFNGGSCVKIEQNDGTFTDHCDCTSAGDENTSYAGRFCQSPSSVFCSKFSEHSDRHFCVNGGECRSDSHLGCDCPEGYTGPVCEFRVRDEEDYSTCNLECQNHGICRKGAKDLSVLNKFNINRLDGSFDDSHNLDFEHCVCPIGYVGLTCEFRLDICPGGSHACMHGAECIPRVSPVTGKLEFRCDCDKADEHDLRYAGKYCQFESTEFCTDNAARPLDGTGAFCVNGGECLSFVPEGVEHPGCNCKNDFQGPHCEYPPEWNAPKAVEEDDEPKGGMAISLTLGCTLLVLVIIFMVVYQRQKARELAFRPKGDSYYRDEGEDYMSSDGDVFEMGEDAGTQESVRPPTITDIEFMVDHVGKETCRDLVTLDEGAEDRSTSATPSDEVTSQICSEPYTLGMSSMGTDGSNNSTFSEDPISGRAMLMKEAQDAGLI